MTAPAPELVIEESADVLARTVADRALRELAGALGSRPVAHLVVTGGGILEAVLRAMRESGLRDDVDWPRVHIWWGDERFVEPDSTERNDRPAFAALFDALPLDPAKIHRMPSTASGYGDDVDAAAAAYAVDLADAAAAGDVPAFDVVLLGIGPDGHCASLFPHHSGLELTEAALGIRNSPKPPPTRLSLSFRALDAARQLWFIASGAGKADAVARAHAPDADYRDVPCSRPRGTERTVWLIDQDAAADLPDLTRSLARQPRDTPAADRLAGQCPASRWRCPMAFVNGVPEDVADDTGGLVAELYAADRAGWGFVPNFATTFSLRPEVYAAWRQLNGAVKASMDLRRYELATLAAAMTLRSSYCSLAHGRVLANEVFSPEDVTAIVTDPGAAPLDATDRAVMTLARKVVEGADRMTEDDLTELRSLGFDDGEVLSVILAAAARCFFSKVLDATGTLPDSAFAALPESLAAALTVGRPIAEPA